MSDSAFPFTICEADSPAESGAFVAIIPRGISNKTELFAQLATQLRFPAYFGHNWDSLEECLRDFSWLAAQRIVIAHHDLPLSSPREQKIYVEILANALDHLQKQNQPKLRVTFTKADQPALRSLLAKTSTDTSSNPHP